MEPGFVETFAATIVELRNSIDMNSTSDTIFFAPGHVRTFGVSTATK